jgi:SecD/SecF fusion protein
VEEVKRLISQMGVLEFRILANGPDDEKGILAARDAIAAAGKGDLRARAERGLPPPSPDGEFEVAINDTKAMVRYAWVELAPEERETLGLANADEGKSALWQYLKDHRDTAVPVAGRSVADPVNCEMLLFSRECVSAERLAKEKDAYDRLKAEQARGSGLTDEQIEAQVNRKRVEYFVLTRVSDADNVRVGGDVTLTAQAGQDKSFNPSVNFSFNGAGAQKFGAMTRRNKPSNNVTRHLAIVLDEKVVSAPGLQAVIEDRGEITGKFDKKSVDRLVQILRSGALSAELRDKPVSENMIGPTLGRDTIRRGTFAIGMAFVAVLVFMVVYYRFAGLVACIALFANLLLTVGFMVAVNAAFTLAGLAGLVLTLGIAVDANVLIYERLREERNKGANIATAIRNGYDRAFATIIDTHLTSIFTAVVLYALGNDNLKGFAISLTVGLIISLFTSLYMTRLMFDYWLRRGWLTELKMMRLFERPNFHPMKYRYVFFTVTALLTVAGLAVAWHRGENVLNVDFRGGTVFAARVKPGEERGLTSIGGTLGYRELLSEERQKDKLAVEKVFWDNKPPTPDTPINTWVYTITYKDGGTQTVTLTEKPAGASDEAMAEDVKQRASHLPDVSVEQTYTFADDASSGKSRMFTVRTTEKQRGLVQAALDRLMRDDGKQLLEGATVTVGPVTGPVVDLTFDKPTSLAFTTELFSREFKRQLSADTGPDTFALTGVGAPVDGRYTHMKLDVSRNPTLEALRDPKNPQHAQQLAAFQKVVAGTVQAFNSTPEPERLEVFDSQVASETRAQAFKAVVASWVIILLYLWFRFGNWTFGLAAVLCLVHDLCFTVGAIAACHYLHEVPGLDFLGIQDFKIDLAAVAALLTLVGYSVSDTIVVFDRIREVRGKNPKLTPQMINDSVNQTLSRTILTSATVFLVSIVLYAFGGEGVHLFAFVMVMGVLVGTYSSIFVAAPLLLIFGEGREAAGAVEEAAPADKEEAGSEEEVVEG